MEEKKSNKHKYWLWFVTTGLLMLQSLPAKSQTVLDSIQETGVLKIAIREDAAPFGYLNSASEIQGYCLDFIALLEKKLKQELPRNTIAIRLLKSTVGSRFQLVRDDSIYLECGPNTIRKLASPEIAFSRPFFQTKTALLIAKNKADRVDLSGDLADVPIGVIRNTSTAKFIRENYPSAKIVFFSGTTARNRGIQALAQGKIAAMISDRILLKAEAAAQNLSIDDYILTPVNINSDEQKTENNFDFYGMIIEGQDAQWQEFVNSVIVSQESKKLFRQWFGSLQSFPAE